MPRVPQSQGPQVTPEISRVTPPTPLQYQRGRASGEDFGAGLARVQERSGRQLQQFGDELSRLALKEQAEDNEREAKRLAVEFEDSRRKITFGDGTPENPGYYNARGEAAVQGRKAAEEAMLKEKQRLAALASNPRVAQMFGSQADIDMSQELKSVARHYGTERQAAENTTSKARIGSAISDASAGWNDEERFKLAKDKVTAEWLSMAESNGLSDDALRAGLRESYTALVKGRFDGAMAAGNVAEAQRILDKHAPLVDGTMLDDMRGKLREGNLETAAFALADEARALYKDPAQQREHINKFGEGKVRSAALTALASELNFAQDLRAEQRAVASHASAMASARAAEDERRKKAEKDEANNAGLDAVLNGQSPETLPHETKLKIGREGMTGLLELYAKRVKGAPSEPNYAAVQEIYEMSPDKLREQNISDWVLKVGPNTEEADKVRDLILSAQRDQYKPDKIVSIFGPIADGLGLIGDKNRDDRGRLLSLVQQEVELRQKNAGGKQLGQEEIRQTVIEVSDRFVLDRGLGIMSPDITPLYKLNIPPAELTRIIDAFKTVNGANATPTKAEVEEMWERVQAQKTKGATSGR